MVARDVSERGHLLTVGKLCVQALKEKEGERVLGIEGRRFMFGIPNIAPFSRKRKNYFQLICALCFEDSSTACLY